MDLQIVHAVQSLASTTLDYLMEAITRFGGQTIFLVAFSITYLLINKNSAIKLTFAFALSLFVNGLKIVVRRDRPHVADLTVNGPHVASDFSFPSGHSQNYSVVTTSFGFALFDATEKTWKRTLYVVLAVVMGALVGLSRIYWGMHYLTDVIAGLALGSICAMVIELIVQYMPTKLKNFGLERLLLVCIAVATVTLVALISAGRYSASLNKDLALFIGIAGGHILNERYVHYDPQNTRVNKWLVALIGTVICVGAYELVQLIPIDAVATPLSYFVTAVLTTTVVPAIIVAIDKRLGKRKRAAATQ